MVNHGLSTGALFLLVGMLYERRHTKRFDQFGGLAKVDPLLRLLPGLLGAGVGRPAGAETASWASSSSSIGLLPRPASVLATIVATSGVILAAVYLLHMLSETICGARSTATRTRNRCLADLSGPRDPRSRAARPAWRCSSSVWQPESFLATEPAGPAPRAVTEYHERLATPPPTEVSLRDQVVLVEAGTPDVKAPAMNRREEAAR